MPLSPAATKILSSSLYPAPINGLNTNNQVNVTHSYTNSDQGDLKIDSIASEKDHVYGRYSQQHISNPTTNSQLLTGNTDNEFPLYNGVIDYTHTFSPFLLEYGTSRGQLLPGHRGLHQPDRREPANDLRHRRRCSDQTFLPSRVHRPQLWPADSATTTSGLAVP